MQEASHLRTHLLEVVDVLRQSDPDHLGELEAGMVAKEMIDRCRTLKLRLAIPPTRVRTQVTLLITVHTMTCLYVGRHEIAL